MNKSLFTETLGSLFATIVFIIIAIVFIALGLTVAKTATWPWCFVGASLGCTVVENTILLIKLYRSQKEEN